MVLENVVSQRPVKDPVGLEQEFQFLYNVLADCAKWLEVGLAVWQF